MHVRWFPEFCQWPVLKITQYCFDEYAVADKSDMLIVIIDDFPELRHRPLLDFLEGFGTRQQEILGAMPERLGLFRMSLLQLVP